MAAESLLTMRVMQLFSCLLLVLGSNLEVHGLIPDRLKDDFFNIYKNNAIETRDILHLPVTPDQVTFYLFTRTEPKEYIRLDTKNLKRLTDKKVKIVFIIHGWANNRKVTWYEDLKDAFLSLDEEYYVVEVDWSVPANQFYSVSSINTYDVANIIGDVVVDLYKNYKVELKNILIVGHSLGGQICGFIGKHFYKKTLTKLHRIIALDPAGPLFIERPFDKRLNEYDAEIVEAMHTDGGTFGFIEPCGTIDFFINGGSTQPGCRKIDLLDIQSVAEPVVCDHLRAYEYFTEAIQKPKEFVAKRCRSWALYKFDRCDKEETTLGNLSTTLTGTFYLETNSERPFSKVHKGGYIWKLYH